MSEVTLVKWGNGQGVRFGKQLVADAGIKIGDSLDARVDEKGNIVLSPTKRKRTITPLDFDALFSGYTGGPVKEDAAAAPFGRELL